MIRIIICILFFLPSPLLAQVTEGPIPREVESRVLELANDPTTLLLQGRARLPAGTSIDGDVVVLGGGLRVGGAVGGALAVVNGDLEFEPGASVTGPVWVLGGRVVGAEAASLEGEPQVFRAPLRYRIRDGRVEGLVDEGDFASRFLATDLGFGRTRFTLRAAGAYNRVEGLPVRFGPIVETAGRNPLVLEAFGIWRSASGLDLDTENLGYDFTLDQGLGGRGTLSLGLEAYSRVHAIEERGLSDQEAALSTFLLSRDHRDHFEASGWAVYMDLRAVRTPVRGRVAFREEEHAFTAVGSPWTLGRGDEPWRPEPRVGEGTARFVEGELEWDTRDDAAHPSDGVHLTVRGSHQLAGAFRTRVGDAGSYAHPHVTRGTLDLRRYARVSPDLRLAIALRASGSLRDDPLPPQFQSALGGEGSLPGHPPFSISCGARDGVVPEPGEADALPGYGCDQTALARVELLRTLPWTWEPGPQEWEGSEWGGLVRVQPEISLFLDAGAGRASNRSGFPVREDSPARADVGVGIVTGSLGLYWAYPLNRKDRGLNFFVRLNHRL